MSSRKSSSHGDPYDLQALAASVMEASIFRMNAQNRREGSTDDSTTPLMPVSRRFEWESAGGETAVRENDVIRKLESFFPVAAFAVVILRTPDKPAFRILECFEIRVCCMYNL